MTFTTGDQVRAKAVDPPHHTRLPSYIRGAVGTVVGTQGAHPVPDDVAQGISAQEEPVYAVRFTATELFGTGDHTVTVSLWERYMEQL
ncbi:SH3-like domain-containing protein [Kibdelosporangium philippinense]|uniref:SH3-like domain-containing protein n=1 Tax=Kibdelosporangium philippinense TaxID=211113 RepID=UPI0035562D08